MRGRKRSKWRKRTGIRRGRPRSKGQNRDGLRYFMVTAMMGLVLFKIYPGEKVELKKNELCIKAILSGLNFPCIINHKKLYATVEY